MADKKDLDPNPPLEDRTILPLKRIAIAHESESDAEFEKQKLEAETSPISHKNKSQIIQSVMDERKINHQTYVSVAETIDNTSRALITKDLLDKCNSAHKAHISAKIDDKVKTDLALVEPLIKTFNTIKKFYPAGCRFRPSDDMMANYYLKNKVLGLPMKARIIPEECHHIFSIPPRDLPGYPREKEWHCYCIKPNGQDPQSLWTRVGEDTTVFDPLGNGVGIKRTYALTEQEEESDYIYLPGEIVPPREEWFIEEISLPSSVADSDLVLCHVILNKIEKVEEYEEEEDDDEEEEDIVDLSPLTSYLKKKKY